MALWQFISLAVPIGALLVYVGVLTTRIGSANTQLRKIAEGLQSLERARAQSDAADSERAKLGTSSGGGNGHVDYQTIRDLRPKQTFTTSPAASTPSVALDTSPVQVARERYRLRKATGVLSRAVASHSIDEAYVPPYLRISVGLQQTSEPSAAATTPTAVNGTLGSNLSEASGMGAYSTYNEAVETTSERAFRPRRTSALQRELPVTAPVDDGIGGVMAATTATQYAEAAASIAVPDVTREAIGETVNTHAPAVEEETVLTPTLTAAEPETYVAALDTVRSADAEVRAKKRHSNAMMFVNNQRRRRRMQWVS